MAHVKRVTGRSYPHMYNVNKTVGNRKEMTSGGGITTMTTTFSPNEKDDVMLVQYLLKKVYQRSHQTEGRLSPGISDPAELKIDGQLGPLTQGAIEHFQIQLRRAGASIATDGSVDPETGLTSTISQTGYTITWLNKYLWTLYPFLAPDIASDRECPPELQDKVFTPLTHRT